VACKRCCTHKCKTLVLLSVPVCANIQYVLVEVVTGELHEPPCQCAKCERASASGFQCLCARCCRGTPLLAAA
jgi:hypothetical protein